MPSVVQPDCDCFRVRDRDKDDEGGQVRQERLYYVQNWRHVVVALIRADSAFSSAVVERIRYDAYCRPSSHGPIDVGVSGGVTGINVSVDNNDDIVLYGSGSGVHWYNDFGSASGIGLPDGSKDSNDSVAYTSVRVDDNNDCGCYGEMSYTTGVVKVPV